MCRLSASCVHVSAILHALVSLNPSSTPNPSTVVPTASDASVPITSMINRWKPPRKRKESSLMMSEAKFQKHVYGRERKHNISELESFDPRPDEYKGTASSLLNHFLEATKGKGLCMSLLFDESARVWKPPTNDDAVEDETSPTPVDYSILSKEKIQVEVNSFKESLSVSEADICRIEQETREQRDCLKWFQMRRFRLTASVFGEICRRKDTTRPDALVLRLLGANGQQRKDTIPMAWGRSNESLALEQYKQTKLASGHYIVVTQSGFLVSPDHPFLGASPDAAVYDPSEPHPYGFAEVKCPYKHRDSTPKDACADSSFCCELTKSESGVEQLQLKKKHAYYCQVQGQMAVGQRPWNDFIIYTTKGISIERIYFDHDLWANKLLPKLTSFYDNCLAPEILHPMHTIGLPIRDLSKP